MRRVVFAVIPIAGGGLGVARRVPPGARLLAPLGVAILAAAMTIVATGPAAREHGVRTASTARLPVAAWGPMSRALGRDDQAYRTTRAGTQLVARNPRQRLRAQFSPIGVSVRSGQLLVGMRPDGYGYGDKLDALRTIAPTARANRVVYRRGSLTEWYANGPAGLEQGFTLSARPARRDAGSLTLALGLSGNVREVLSRGRSVLTLSHGGSSLSYRGLVVTDSQGRTLPGWLQLHGRELLLHIKDAGAQYPLTIDPFIQQAKLTASDGAAADAFGTSVAIDDDTIVAGAPSPFANTTSRGAAYVFVKPKHGWQEATETAKLTASDGAAGDALGTSVAIDGDTIVAGAPGATVNGLSQGAVYVFHKPKRGWRSESETAKLTASESSMFASLGSAVAIRGDTVVASAPFVPLTVENGDEGVVYVFSEPKSGWRSETETANLTASDQAANGALGLFSVGISGDTIVAAGGGGSVSQRNGVYVFGEPKGGWRSETQTAKLTASDGNFIGSPAIDGHTIVAGAVGSTVNGNPDQGAVYVFVEPKRGWRSETETAKLTASDGAPEDGLGISVAVQSDTIVAGAYLANNFGPGAIYMFVKPRGGWTTKTQTAKLIASDSAGLDELGLSVAILGHTIVGGAPNATLNGNSSEGAAYVFRDHDSQTAAGNRSSAPHPRAPTVLRRPARCTRYPSHHGAFAPPVSVGAITRSSQC